MNDEREGGVSTIFWVVAGLALVWNLMGVWAFHGDYSSGNLAQMAVWGATAFGVAVFGGALLLLKKALSVPVLIASLIGVVVQMYYNLAVAQSTEVYGPGEYTMLVMIPGVAIFLIWYARSAKGKGWIA